MVLFGFSYLYGVTGTTNLTSLHAALVGGSGEPMPAVLRVAVVAVVAGLAFRVTAVPFHFYAPDVFQGTAATGAALLAVVPKIAGLAALLRLLFLPPGSDGWFDLPTSPSWTLASEAMPVLWLLAVASILVGNFVALLQTDVRRLLAWSSIAHAGYMLVGLTVGAGGGRGGLEAMLFYLAAYVAMTVGAFAVLVAAGRQRTIATIDDLGGLSRTRPAAALAMTVFLLSLIGLPPTAGFLGKLNLLLAAWAAETSAASAFDLWWLAVVLAAGAAIGAWYYLRLIGTMYLGQPRDESHEPTGLTDAPALIGVACCALVTVGLFVLPGLLWPLVERLRWPLIP
jgi:NADH-quinone oxidoreductase subunit N